ncbi:MAG: methionyl-tRNA formyltransferase [candidate division KSB1 bacterium]|nr:methionyl-tRNA formyltransferase [candidate division KSB1 bacterium]
MASDNRNLGRIIFMGSPDFAVASAGALWQAGLNIVGVVTTPDKPAGRGLTLKESPVKQWARQHDLPVLQPEDLRDVHFLQALHELDADLFVVVAFRILPREVFTLPSKGTLNLHASLLPKYRGAAPIQWAIIEGERETGVTTVLINENVDTGDILLQKTVPIGKDETYGELYERLKHIGAELLVETVVKWLEGSLHPRKQIGTATRAPKIKPEMGYINWNQPAERIRNLVRGLSPVPAAYTHWNDRRLKIYRCRTAEHDSGGAPGEIVQADAKKGVFMVKTGEGALLLEEVQPEGKRRMQAAEFLRGYPVKAGDRFE